MVASLLGLALLTVTPATADRSITVLVTDLQARGGVPPDAAHLITQQLVASVRRSRAFDRVTSTADVATLLSAERLKQALDCGSESCMAELAGSMGATHLLAGDVGKVGTVHILSVRLMEVKTVGVLATASRTEESDDVGRFLKQADSVVAELLAPLAPVAADGAGPAAAEANTQAADAAAAPQDTATAAPEPEPVAESSAPSPMPWRMAALTVLAGLPCMAACGGVAAVLTAVGNLPSAFFPAAMLPLVFVGWFAGVAAAVVITLAWMALHPIPLALAAWRTRGRFVTLDHLLAGTLVGFGAAGAGLGLLLMLVAAGLFAGGGALNAGRPQPSGWTVGGYLVVLSAVAAVAGLIHLVLGPGMAAFGGLTWLLGWW